MVLDYAVKNENYTLFLENKIVETSKMRKCKHESAVAEKLNLFQLIFNESLNDFGWVAFLSGF